MIGEVNDIMLNDSLDLLIQNGDFVIDDADEQIQELILLAAKGSFRQSPLTGVNIASFLKSRLTPAAVDKIRQLVNLQMQYDGFTSSTTTIVGNQQIENVVVETTR